MKCSIIVVKGLVLNIDQGLHSTQRGIGIQSCSSWEITHPPLWVQVDWLIPPYWFLHYLSSGFYWFLGNIQRKWQGLKYIQISLVFHYLDKYVLQSITFPRVWKLYSLECGTTNILPYCPISSSFYKQL